MFGTSREEVGTMIDEAVRNLRNHFEKELKRVGNPPSASELAREALREIMSSASSKEFLENLLLTKGLTVESLVRSAVLEELKSDSASGVLEQVAENINQELDTDELYEKIAERLTALVMKDYKNELVAELADRLSDAIYDAIDLDDLYPILGELVLEALRKRGD